MTPGEVAPAADEIDDLDLVAVTDQRRGKRVTPDDDHVVFDGNTPGIDVQPFEQLLHRHWMLEIVRVPVERNTHGRGLAEFYSTESDGSVRGLAAVQWRRRALTISAGTVLRANYFKVVPVVGAVVVGVVSSSSSPSSSPFGPCILT